jgi:hypothetical protein
MDWSELKTSLPGRKLEPWGLAQESKFVIIRHAKNELRKWLSQ